MKNRHRVCQVVSKLVCSRAARRKILRQGAADRSEHRQAAGAIALNVIVATGSDTRGECNMPKCTLARRSQLALALRRECSVPESLVSPSLIHPRLFNFSHPARPATLSASLLCVLSPVTRDTLKI